MKSHRKHAQGAIVAASAAIFALAGCNVLLGADEYSFTTPAQADAASAGDAMAPDAVATDGDDAGCVDPSGFGGKGCWRCERNTREELLNGCTGASCQPFDNARVTKLSADGGLPPVPANPPPDGGGGGGGDGDAGAPNTDCTSLPNPVYVVGGTATKNFLGIVAQTLALQGTTVVFKSESSCSAVDAVLNGTLKTASGSSAAVYWDPAIADVKLAEKKCDIAGPGVVIDMGRSDIFPQTCIDLPQGLPPTVQDIQGPIQTLVLAAPASSPETSISAEATYSVYGFGAESGVEPWTDAQYIFKRSTSTGSLRMTASILGIPVNDWKGTATKSGDDMVNQLFAVPAGSEKRAIGLMFSDSADANRVKLKPLAFQDRGQHCGFWPDSTPTALDKRNVRDGHYHLWGPSHFVVRVNSSGVPPKPAVSTLLGYATGTIPYPKGDIVQIYASDSLVPQCAMRVVRETEGGAVKPYDPPSPCGCYFEQVATGATSCQSCSVPTDCPSEAPRCSFGYCEK